MLEALRGAILLGIGGTILFSLYYLLTLSTDHSSSGLPVVAVVSFLGFVAIGLGLALIVQLAKNK